MYKIIRIFKSLLKADKTTKFFYEATFKIFQIKMSGRINK